MQSNIFCAISAFKKVCKNGRLPVSGTPRQRHAYAQCVPNQEAAGSETCQNRARLGMLCALARTHCTCSCPNSANHQVIHVSINQMRCPHVDASGTGQYFGARCLAPMLQISRSSSIRCVFAMQPHMRTMHSAICLHRGSH